MSQTRNSYVSQSLEETVEDVTGAWEETKTLVDMVVGRPLAKRGYFAADSRRNREYRRQTEEISTMTYLGAVAGAGPQPRTVLESIDNYVESFDAETVSKLHINAVDPAGGIGMFVKGGGAVFAFDQLGLPPEHGAAAFTGAYLGRGIQAGIRQYRSQFYDEHWTAPVSFVTSPLPWGWLGAGVALQTKSYMEGESLREWSDVKPRTVAEAHENGLKQNKAHFNDEEIIDLYAG